MSSIVKLMFFLQKSMGIIESGMGGMTSLLQIITLLFYIKNHLEENQHADGFLLNVVYFFNITILVYFISLLRLIGENPRR